MGNNIAFQACGKTYQANVTANAAQVTVVADSPCNQLYVANPGANAGFFLVTSNASVNVALPGANASYALVIAAGTEKVFTVPQQFSNTVNTYISFIGTANTTCYFTPGEGL